MTYLLPEEESKSYLNALKLIKTANVWKDNEELCSHKDLEFLFLTLKLGGLHQPPEPIRIDYPLANKAKDIFREILQKIKQMVKDENNTIQTKKKKNFKKSHKEDEKTKQLKRLEAVIHLQLGKILWRTEHFKEGEKELSMCWLIVENDFKDGVTMQVKQVVLNECGLLSLKQGNLEKSFNYFEEAKKLYEKFKDPSSPWCVDDFFSVEAYDPSFQDEEKRKFVFLRNFVETSYNLTLTNIKMKKTMQSVFDILKIMSIQLENDSYNVFEWLHMALDLSNFFNLKKCFNISRHCMAAAETILKQKEDCPSNLNVMESRDFSSEEKDHHEKLTKSWANLYLSWAKYCKELLSVHASMPTVSGLRTFSFPLDVTECESQVITTKVLSFDEAKDLYLKGLGWLKRSKDLFNVKTICIEYIELEIMNSDLLYHLFIYEPESNRKCKILKRGIDILNELFSKVYLQGMRDVAFQISFQLAGSYFLIAKEKYEILKLQKTPSPSNTKAVAKMTFLANKSIEFAKMYIQYIGDNSGRLPDTLSGVGRSNNVQVHYFIACMHARLYYVGPIKDVEITKIANEFSYVIDFYCKYPPIYENETFILASSKEELSQLTLVSNLMNMNIA